jgi:hypothetical protein
MAVMLRMRLAGFRGMVMGMMAMARSGMGVMRGGVGVFFFIMLGGFAVMMRGLFMMLGGVVMMLAGGMFVRHGVTPCDAPRPDDAVQRHPRRGFATGLCRVMPFAQISFRRLSQCNNGAAKSLSSKRRATSFLCAG